MRLQELYTEGEFDEGKFERDCAFYLDKMGHAAKETRLYRGTTSERAKAGQRNPWTARSRPVDSPGWVHESLNELLEKKFGKPWRNGLFTTGSMGVADTYGEPYIVVPAGKFEWLCNTEIEDTFSLFSDNEPGTTDEQIFSGIRESKKWKHNEDLPGCASSRCEVMLWCPDGYYLFDPEEDLPRAIS